jgi:tripartite-type tricarboxylate transporter receptor subunit TctC
MQARSSLSLWEQLRVGGYDLLSRVLAAHMGSHILGKPTIVVSNMPAAGGIAAANLLGADRKRAMSSFRRS